ncbi:glycosyl transferase, partial [Streptomyces sp. SID4940]
GGQPPGQGTQQGGGQAPGNAQGTAPGGTPGRNQGQNQGQAPGNGAQAGGMPGGGMGEGGPGGGGGGMGGLLGGSTVDTEATTLLGQNADAYTWVAAAVGSQNAASYQLATGDPVMAIGGFNGSDPSPTLAQFKQYVDDGEIHYFVSGGMGGGGAGSEGTSSQISAWVEENFKEVTVQSATFYDLTQPVSGSTS